MAKKRSDDSGQARGTRTWTPFPRSTQGRGRTDGIVDLLPILAPRRQALHNRLSDTAAFEPGDEPFPRPAFEVVIPSG